MKKNLLMLASRSPYPLTAGFRLRIHYLAKLLSKIFDVDLFCLQSVDMNGRKASPFNKIFTFPITLKRFGFNALRYYYRGWPLQVGCYYSSDISRWLKKCTKTYEMLYVHHIRMAPYTTEFEGFRLLDYHDAISMHYRESKKYAKGLWKIFYSVEESRLLRFELKMLEIFNGAFINSPVDQGYLLKHSKSSNPCPLEVLPMGVREEVLNYKKKPEELQWIVMTGRMAYYPNREGAIYFASNVFPKLKRKYKELKFYIVGSDPAPDVRKLARIPGVIVTGYVPDPWTYITKARVIIAPIRLGAGIQNKVLEAMALAKPVVATSLAVQGIQEGIKGQHYLIANTPEEMVEIISTLIDNKRQREEIGQEARQLILKRYTWNNVGERLFNSLEKWL
ncbi:MAG: glycosyltransferase [Candidatus Helarchaeota archaeon]